MDNLPDINLGKTSSRLHALARYGRKNLITGRKDVLHAIKQIKYSIKQVQDMYANTYDISIRMRDDRVSTSRFIRVDYTNELPRDTRSYLRIDINKQCIPKNIGNYEVFDYKPTDSRIFHTPDAFAIFGSIIVMIAINFKAKTSPDDMIDRLTRGIRAHTECQIIDKFPSTLFVEENGNNYD
jgi:hypothetical protein